MRIIAHLSDLHFGRIDPQTLEPLLSSLQEIAPHVVVVSGDFTQRAKETEFRQAREYLNRMPQPQIVTPGNHDVPLYDLISRFARPLDRYRRFISEDLQPAYEDDEIAVAAVNTARSWTFKGGRINQFQVSALADRLCHLKEAVKIVVTHHPFDLPDGYTDKDLLRRARMAMEKMAECGADVFLSGHLHVSHTGQTANRYHIRGHSALVVHAGTATSTRGRGEANSFNVLRIDRESISIERRAFDADRLQFLVAATETFRRGAAGWIPA